MELIALGVGGSWSPAGGGTSGYLLREGGFSLLVDAGSGTLGRLQEEIRLADLGAVVVTHGHPDHFVDLYPLFYARHYGRQGPPGLPLFAPTGFFELLGSLVSPESRAGMQETFDVRTFEPGASFQVGPFTVGTRQMAHLGIPAAGYRFEANGSALAYSGDTGPTPELVELSRGADLLLCEATWQDGDDLLPFHLSARQAGEHARAAGAARLVLTHLWPSLDPAGSQRQASEAFDGPVEVAVEGMRIRL